MAFNKSQQYFLDLAHRGHNLVHCEQAGTGKTYIVTELTTKQLKQVQKYVALTCTTGLSCLNFPVV